MENPASLIVEVLKEQLHLSSDIVVKGLISGGLFGKVYSAHSCGTSYAIKLSKKGSPLAKEAYAMSVLAGLGFAVPKVFVSSDTLLQEFNFLVMEKCTGSSFASLLPSMTLTEMEEAGRLIGVFMHEMHASVSLASFGEFEDFNFAENSWRFSDAWVGKIVSEGFLYLADCVAENAMSTADVVTVVNYLCANKGVIANSSPTFIHGDVFPEHIFFERSSNNVLKISGFIDFGYASAKPFEYDFIKLHRSGMFENGAFMKGLKAGYGPALEEPTFLDRVFFYRVVRDVGFSFFLLKNGAPEVAKSLVSALIEGIRIRAGK
jgi:Ser/Thr protein kinase RdoA (MazF antagonist)